ncbi:putative ammonium transporter protein [Paraphysoderma sedebokerense]|nr:putative ammonium transporter protein [Paraphysoderma sedebokerense]
MAEATPTPPGIESGNTAWVLTSTALVFIMIPGLGYFYSGLAREKNALSLLLISLISVAVVLIQWFLFGFSLSFSTTGGPFIGNFDFALFRNVYTEGSVMPAVSTLTLAIFQGMFASITPALAVGAAAERFSFGPMIVFIFIWTTLVYDFLAYWTWGANGWLYKLGALDYAGGTPVHMSSGFAGLALAIYTGKRNDVGHNEPLQPHSMSSVILGTALLWFGWLGFNGGSGLGANSRAANALIVSNLAACAAGLTWMLIDYIRDRRVSALGFCSGVVAGLVCITPGSGFVGPAAALLFGFLGGVVCCFSTQIKHRLGFDDTLDVFAIHGVGGVLGAFLTGIFAEQHWIATDGTNTLPGGAINGHGMQILYQLASIGAGCGWSFVVTYIILFVMGKVGLNLRVSEDKEEWGVDHTEMGENTIG